MTSPIQWDDAPVFLAVAREGTLTAAAERLDTGVATISRRIQRLETALGVPLFLRHQSGYVLTDEGRALVPRAEAVELAMQGFCTEANREAEDMEGHVRLATAETLATSLLVPALAPLLTTYPKLTIEVLTGTSTLNLHRHDADLAIRMVRPLQGNVTARKLGTLGFGLYGSTAYVQARPSTSLSEHRFIGWTQQQADLPAARWLAENELCASVLTTSLLPQLHAAKAGMGLAILPHFLASEAELVQVPASLQLDQSIWLVMHTDVMASKRIRVVADRLVEVIRENRERLETARS